MCIVCTYVYYVYRVKISNVFFHFVWLKENGEWRMAKKSRSWAGQRRIWLGGDRVGIGGGLGGDVGGDVGG